MNLQNAVNAAKLNHPAVSNHVKRLLEPNKISYTTNILDIVKLINDNREVFLSKPIKGQGRRGTWTKKTLKNALKNLHSLLTNSNVASFCISNSDIDMESYTKICEFVINSRLNPGQSNENDGESTSSIPIINEDNENNNDDDDQIESTRSCSHLPESESKYYDTLTQIKVIIQDFKDCSDTNMPLLMRLIERQLNKIDI
jgi:hypothetical protein